MKNTETEQMKATKTKWFIIYNAKWEVDNIKICKAIGGTPLSECSHFLMELDEDLLGPDKGEMELYISDQVSDRIGFYHAGYKYLEIPNEITEEVEKGLLKFFSKEYSTKKITKKQLVQLFTKN